MDIAKSTVTNAVQTIQDTAGNLVTKAQDTFNTAVNFVKEQTQKLIDTISTFSEQMCEN